jgi:adenosine deaminase
MTDILITTFGISWQIIPELIGFTNPETVDLYKNHADYSGIKLKYNKHKLSPVDEIWLIGTGGQKTVETLDYIRSWHSLLDKKTRPDLKVWLVKNADDLASEHECRLMAETIHRVVLLASEKTADSNLFLSLTGGRKTMSSDLQNAASFFGCKAMLHIIDNFEETIKLKNKPPEFFLNPLPKELRLAFTPVIAGKYNKNTLAEIDPKIVSQNFPVKYPENKNPVFTEFDNEFYLTEEIEKRKNNASNLVFNYSKNLIQGENHTNFLALYTLPPEIIKSLKNYKIGADKNKLDSDYKILKKLPKSELHCHLGGIADPLEIIEIALTIKDELKQLYPELENYLKDASELVKKEKIDELRIQYNPKEIRTIFHNIPEPYSAAAFILLFENRPELLEEFIYDDLRDETTFCFKGFSVYEKTGDLQGSGLLQHEKTLKKACEIIKRKAIYHNVKYLEVRCSPHNYTRGGLKPEKAAYIIEQEFKNSNEIKSGIIYIASRHGKMSAVYRHVELAENILKQNTESILRGFDLAGDEKARRPSEIREAFLPLMEKCMHFTIHAGENMPAANIWEAVYHLNAERIGHGLTLKENPELMKKFTDSNTTLEMCPSSNFQIGKFRDFMIDSTKKYPLYPLKYYLDQGLKVTVNTDNPGISRTDFTNEILKAARMTENGLSLWEIFILIRNGLKSSFTDMEEKKNLLKNAENEILNLIINGDLYE